MNLYGNEFNNPMLGVSLNVFTFEDSDKEWFIGKDVATMLGYSQPRNAIYKNVPDECKFKLFVDDLIIGRVLGGDAQTVKVHNTITLINEEGLYRLVSGSTLPAAETFKTWVFREVLPSIRKDGGYIVASPFDDPIMIESRKERAVIEALLRREDDLVDIYSKLNYAEIMQSSDDGIFIGDFAHILSSNGISIGRNRLFEWLRINGYLGHRNQPYQYFIDDGLFKVKQSSVTLPDGRVITNQTPLITTKGQNIILAKLQGTDDWRALDQRNMLSGMDYNHYQSIFGPIHVDQEYLGYTDEQARLIQMDADDYYRAVLLQEKDQL